MNYEKIFMFYLLEEKLSLKDKILLHLKDTHLKYI